MPQSEFHPGSMSSSDALTKAPSAVVEQMLQYCKDLTDKELDAVVRASSRMLKARRDSRKRKAPNTPVDDIDPDYIDSEQEDILGEDPWESILGPTRVIVGRYDAEWDFWVYSYEYATFEDVRDFIKIKVRRFGGRGLNGLFLDRELCRPVTTLDEMKKTPVVYADPTAVTLKEMRRKGLGLGLEEEAQW